MNNTRIPVSATREVVTQWLIEGATYRDIAQATGLSLGTIHKIATDPNSRVYSKVEQQITEAFHRRSQER